MNDELFDPDPLRMGLAADLRCGLCRRDRYQECVRSLKANVVNVDGGIIEIIGVPCTCGATRIKVDWLPPGPDAEI